MTDTLGINKIAVGDSDSLIAIISQKDLHHRKAVSILKRLIADNVELIYPAAIIAETITTLVRKHKDAKQAGLLVDQILKGELKIVDTTELILKIAGSFYNEKETSRNTFFDAVVAATAMWYSTKLIFSFDKFYPKINFTLAKA